MDEVKVAVAGLVKAARFMARCMMLRDATDVDWARRQLEARERALLDLYDGDVVDEDATAALVEAAGVLEKRVVVREYGLAWPGFEDVDGARRTLEASERALLDLYEQAAAG